MGDQHDERRDAGDGWLRDVARRFLGDLPSHLLLFAAIAVVLLVFAAVSSPPDSPRLALALVASLVAVLPLAWMRWERPLVRGRRRATRRTIAVVAAGCLWMVAVLTVSGLVLVALGLD